MALVGRIYQLTNSETNHVYIGSTTRSLSDRIGDHRYKAKNNIGCSRLYEFMRTIGVEKFAIALLEKGSFDSKEELHAREYEVIQAYKAKIGELCLNTLTTGDFERTKEMRAHLSAKLKAYRANMSEEAKIKLFEWHIDYHE